MAWMKVANNVMNQMKDKRSLYSPIRTQSENAVNKLASEYKKLAEDDEKDQATQDLPEDKK